MGKQLSDKDFLELGKRVSAIMDLGYPTKKDALIMSFYRGIASGFGVFLGGTVVVTLLLWLLSLFSDNLILRPVVKSVQDILKNGK